MYLVLKMGACSKAARDFSWKILASVVFMGAAFSSGREYFG